MHLVNTMKKNQLQHHHKYSILYRISLKIEATYILQAISWIGTSYSIIEVRLVALTCILKRV